MDIWCWQAWLYKASTDPPLFGAGSYGSFRMGQYGIAWEEELRLQGSNSTASTESTHLLRPPYVKDSDGVWRCSDCLDEDERDFGAFQFVPKQAFAVLGRTQFFTQGSLRQGWPHAKHLLAPSSLL